MSSQLGSWVLQSVTSMGLWRMNEVSTCWPGPCSCWACVSCILASRYHTSPLPLSSLRCVLRTWSTLFTGCTSPAGDREALWLCTEACSVAAVAAKGNRGFDRGASLLVSIYCIMFHSCFFQVCLFRFSVDILKNLQILIILYKIK